MAEVAGLVLGAVGVVGVRGAFKNAVELFSLINAPQKFSRDYEITSTQLDIEKLILLQGADHVRLLGEDYDRRLDDVDIGPNAMAGVVERHDQVQSVVDLHSVKMIGDSSVGSHKAFAECAEYELRRREEASQNRILDLNWFRMIEDRRDSVKWSKVEKSGKCDGKKCHKYDKCVDCVIWKAARLQKPGESLSLPTTAETTFAMETFEKRYNGRKAFCFFFDGDDELEGDYMDNISILEQLTANKPIKAVVLSRPIPKCAMAFGQLPQLRLKDLNRPDIYTYVQIQLRNTVTCGRYLDQADAILYALIDKSAGGFFGSYSRART
ncbi:hypothetical protein SUNI508_09979 [Seiridium unicorne]|uniref:Prion-inhibition and propagation HeLo domain-containing protein n=1 Tax=Seiridium unicorne TaxID=138068 RepID=A0ABR2UNC1_9PEZI